MLVIVLLFAIYLMVTGGPARANDWEVTVDQPVWDIYAGNDSMLYAFMGETGNTVCAMDGFGNLKWKVQVPGEWRVLNPYYRPGIPGAGGPQVIYKRGGTQIVSPVYAYENGTLYIYLRENKATVHNRYPWEMTNPRLRPDNASLLEERLLAISNGRVLWNTSLGDNDESSGDVSLYAKNSRVYAFSGNNLTVLDGTGAVIQRINDISYPPAIDEEGYVYAVVLSETSPLLDTGYRENPNGTVMAYYPNGTLYWKKYVEKPLSGVLADETIGQQFVRSTFPLYNDRTLYLALKDGVMAISTNGTALWSLEFDTGYYYPFPSLPVDANGNVYLEYHLDMNGGSYVKVIDKAGHNLTTFNRVNGDWQAIAGDPYEGWLYEEKATYPVGNYTLENLTTIEVRAHNLATGENDWTYSVPVYNKSTLVLDNNTVSTLAEYVSSSGRSAYWDIVENSKYVHEPTVFPYYPHEIAVGKDVIYVSFFMANYEAPVVLGKSKCTYAGGIYALGKNGTLLWYKPTGAFAGSLTVSNSTVYYATRNGKIGAGGMDTLAGGITLAALAYVLIRFFLIGAVARAKNRLGKNENRNSVLKYIADNPGSTLREVSRGLGMNMGTLRYHIFILGMNHRIVPYMADDKHVRYFTNSGTFTKEEQLIISLMRRDGMRRVLGLLQENPGLSNGEMSGRLNMQDSAVSRYLKEFIRHGIVEKGQTREGKTIFSVKGEYRPRIACALARIDNSLIPPR